jgi:serine protease Do
MRHIFRVFVCLVLTACASGHQTFYKPFGDAKSLQDVQFLGKGEEPQIFSSNNLDRDAKIAMSRGYLSIGASDFNGEQESVESVINQAKSVGALLVLVNSKFTESRYITMPLFIPDNRTTYHSGSMYGMNGSSSYTGTSSSYGTKVVPMTTRQERYDQTAVYFVKSTKKAKFGLVFEELTLDLRLKYERNNGVLISVVLEESAAFKANILPGDVLIQLNDTVITNVQQALSLMQNYSPQEGRCILKIIRNGTEKNIEIKFS